MGRELRRVSWFRRQKQPARVEVTRTKDGNGTSVSIRGQHIDGDTNIQVTNGEVTVNGKRLEGSGSFLMSHDPNYLDALRREALEHNAEMDRRRALQEEGLHHKYNVTKRSTGRPVTDCFVLVPSKDPAAKTAMAAYADATDNPHLAEDLRAWVASIEE